MKFIGAITILLVSLAAIASDDAAPTEAYSSVSFKFDPEQVETDKRRLLETGVDSVTIDPTRRLIGVHVAASNAITIFSDEGNPAHPALFEVTKALAGQSQLKINCAAEPSACKAFAAEASQMQNAIESEAISDVANDS